MLSWLLYFCIKVAQDSNCYKIVCIFALRFMWLQLFCVFSDEDLRSKLQDLDSLHEGIRQGTRKRADELDRTLGVAETFAREYQDIIRMLRDIQDNLLSQDSPGVDPATIKEQQKELQVSRMILLTTCILYWTMYHVKNVWSTST